MHVLRKTLAVLAVVLLSPKASVAGTFTYGQHYPQGTAAVDYLYGPNGMWKHLNPAEYIWNYYPQYATANHPYNKDALINYANGTHFTTTRDANGHLLLDFNHVGELSVTDGGYSFCEHNGKGQGGQTLANPFTNFWFDDNWLARYVSTAYGRTAPNGLSSYNDFTRWRILDGNTSNWAPYNQGYYDTLALDGLYYLSSGNVGQAFAHWNQMLANSGYSYDGSNQRYVYPNVSSTYYYGLWLILTENLLDSAGLSAAQYDLLVQHSVSLRSQILSLQQQDGAGNSLGWITSATPDGSLMNTESLSACVLGLGADAKLVFEAGRAPLQANPNNYFLRPHNVLSAVVGLSSAGYMTYGPYRNLPVGSYSVEFYLRAPSPSGTMARLEIYDSSAGKSLVATDVSASGMKGGNTWTRVVVPVTVANAGNSLELRIWWYGTANLDVAFIRLR